MDAWCEPELVIDGGGPIARQIEDQLRRQILDGVLRPGEELPTVRCLAVALAVNPHVVEEAYGTVEREGFLTLGDGGGPRVAAAPAAAEGGKLDNWCRDFLCRATAEGYSPAEVIKALHASIDRGTRHGESC